MSERRATKTTRPRRRPHVGEPSAPRSRRSRDAEQRRLEAARLHGLAEMAGHLGHEINNTLAAILLRVETLAVEPAPSADGREGLEVIQEATRKGLALVQRVRELARLARPLAPGPVDLAGAVADALGALRERLARGRWDLTTDHPPLAPVQGSRQELALAITHLIANALDAMPGGGPVRIATGAEAASIYCRVVDAGHGVAADVGQRIFEPFVSTRGEPGRGLGLLVARAVAFRHGGDVDLAPGTGGGIVATLRLPRPR